MDPSDPSPFTTTQDLPPYRAILAVDARGFTDQPGVLHQTISGLIPELVGLAFTNIGLADVWEDPAFFGPAGDGFAVGVPTRYLPWLIHPFLPELQRVLAAHNHAVQPHPAQVQLRVSLNVGPLPADQNLFLGGNGASRNDTHRLLDSVPVRAILSAASPKVTFVAAILSDRVYQDVVAQGYTGRHPDHFVEVPATVEGKRFSQRAWLYVPEPSGSLVDVGLPAPEAVVSRASSDSSAAGHDTTAHTNRAAVRVKTNKGQVAGNVFGGMRQEGKRS